MCDCGLTQSKVTTAKLQKNFQRCLIPLTPQQVVSYYSSQHINIQDVKCHNQYI